MLHYFVGDRFVGSCHEGEEALFNEEVAVGFEVAETDWVFELDVFDLGVIWPVL